MRRMQCNKSSAALEVVAGGLLAVARGSCLLPKEQSLLLRQASAQVLSQPLHCNLIRRVVKPVIFCL